MSRPKPNVSALLALLVLGLLAPHDTASASELTDEDFAVLVDEVERDSSLFGRLEDVTAVGGQPADLEVPFAIETADDRSARLAELRRAESTPTVDSDVARTAAQEILDNEPFANPDPNLLQRAIRTVNDAYQSGLGVLGELLSAGARKIADAIESLGIARPGRRFAWVFTIVVIGAALTACFRLLKVRQRGERALADDELLGGSLLPNANADPDEYERRAEAAERDGDLAEALRLWFAVGVLRLHRAKRIRYRSTTTMADLRRQVNDPVFERVASVFEWSVYGGYNPSPSDLARFRDDWSLLLEPARSTS